MSAATFAPSHLAGHGAQSRVRSFFRALFDAFVASRTHRAEIEVLAYLQRQDDRMLASVGYSASQIRRIRNGVFPRG